MLGTSAPESLALGQLGSNLIIDGDTTSRTGDWGIVHAISTTVIEELTSSTVKNSADSALVVNTAWNGIRILGGDRIFGRFSQIKLTSGTALLYKI